MLFLLRYLLIFFWCRQRPTTDDQHTYVVINYARTPIFDESISHSESLFFSFFNFGWWTFFFLPIFCHLLLFSILLTWHLYVLVFLLLLFRCCAFLASTSSRDGVRCGILLTSIRLMAFYSTRAGVWGGNNRQRWNLWIIVLGLYG